MFFRGESAGHLPEGVVYQLSHFDMTVTNYIGIIHYVHVFSQLVGTDGGFRNEYRLALFTVWQGDADVESAFQQSFWVVQSGTQI